MKSGVGRSEQRDSRLRSRRSFVRCWLPGAAAMSCVLIGALASQPQDARDARRPFMHRDHVSTHWYGSASGGDRDAEYARDCRGCHDQGADAPRDPRDSCGACHFDYSFADAADAGLGAWLLHLDPDPDSGRAATAAETGLYRHRDHLALACRECHYPASEQEEVHVPSAADTGYCMRCHDRTAPAALESVVSEAVVTGPLDMAALRSRLLSKLNADPALQLPGRGPFLHGDHLRPEELSSPDRCGECHAAVPASSALDLHAKTFDTQSCGSCHIAAEGARVEVRAPERRPRSATAFTFEHRDHLRSVPSADWAQNCSPEGAESIRANGCVACHAVEQPARAPAFALQKQDYAGCMTCHDVERFRTKDHGRWDACAACHALDGGAMESDRITAQVLRSRPGAVTFDLPGTPHPGLGDKANQQCTDCHKAALPAAPPRRTGLRFDHAQHLPKDPKPESCDACHAKRVNPADASERIGLPWTGGVPSAIDPASFLTFEPDACTTCHPGVRVEPASLGRAEPRTVPAFSHAHHLAKAKDPARPGAAVQCSTCHAVETEKTGQLVGTLPSAQDCTQCHQHDAEHAPWTGQIHGAQVESCAVCHEDRMPPRGRVPAGPVLEPGRIALNGAQFHPDDRSCSECHIDNASAHPVAKPSSADVVAASGARFTIHANNKYPEDCRSCHWALSLDNLGNQAPTLETRKREGARLIDFPGGQGAEEMRQRFLAEQR